MIKSILLFVIFFYSSFLYAQSNKIWIYLKDKQTQKTWNPENHFSPRALEKRKRQNISFDEKDFPVSIEYLSELNKINGIRIIHTSKWLNAVSVELKDLKEVNTLANLPFVKKTEIVKMLKSHVKNIEIEEKFGKIEEGTTTSETDYFASEYGNAYNQTSMIKTNVLHEKGYKGEDMLIAVFDAGYTAVDTLSVFKPLRDENRITYMHNFVNPNEDVFRYNTHGTSVLSLMASLKPGAFIGTAPLANYCLFITEDSGQEMPIEEDHWLKASEIADSLGVDVINSSLGYTTFNDTALSHTYASMDGNTTVVTKAADIAASKGILVVNSAGNEGNQSWHYISAPADADSILTVGAVNDKGIYAAFSSVGPTYDGRVKPNVVAQGKDAYVVAVNGTINKGSGTSFSSPIIAGSVACLWQSAKEKGNMDILRAVEESASQAIFADNYLGYGIPDFSKAFLALNPLDTFPLANDYGFIFPNPIKDKLYLRYFSIKDQTLKIEIANQFMQTVYSSEHQINKDFNEIRFDLSKTNLQQSGLHYLIIESFYNKTAYKFVKIN